MDVWKKHRHTENGKIAHKFLKSVQSPSASPPVPTNGGFHRKCYQRFTDATKVEKVAKAKRSHEFAGLSETTGE